MNLPSSPVWRWILPVLAGVVFIGTLSYMAPGRAFDGDDLAPGKYALNALQEGQKEIFRGPAYFEYAGRKGLMDSRVFKLRFVNPSADDGTGFGFLIPLAGSGEAIRPEEYRTSRKDKGSMNGFSTVFGYADLRGDAPTLYFTESGKIMITEAGPDAVSGNLDIILKDAEGRLIHLTGGFRALALSSEARVDEM
jgi:hypothetical protein